MEAQSAAGLDLDGIVTTLRLFACRKKGLNAPADGSEITRINHCTSGAGHICRLQRLNLLNINT